MVKEINMFEINRLLEMSPIECYAKILHPYSKSLHENIIKFIHETNARIYDIDYSNPCMKYNHSMAEIHYIDTECIKKYVIILDKADLSSYKRQ